MNFLLRALWDRLLPPGGDVVVATDERETFMPGGRPLRFCWLGYRPEPQPIGDWLDDSVPRQEDLSPDDDCCWWWNELAHSWMLTHHESLEPGDLWLPYRAIAEPRAEP